MKNRAEATEATENLRAAIRVRTEKALITPLLPALETELNLAHDCLAYGGVTDQQDGVTIYLVVNKRTQEEMYVKVENGKLVVVEKKG